MSTTGEIAAVAPLTDEDTSPMVIEVDRLVTLIERHGGEVSDSGLVLGGEGTVTYRQGGRAYEVTIIDVTEDHMPDPGLRAQLARLDGMRYWLDEKKELLQEVITQLWDETLTSERARHYMADLQAPYDTNS